MTAADYLNVTRTLPLRIEDFLLLNDTGAFEGYGKTELIDGGIVYMNAQHRPHAKVKMYIARALDKMLGDGPPAVLTEVTIAIPPHNAPEPDIVVTSAADGDGPVPLASVRLIVEVSDTTLRDDLGIKLKLYARNGIPEYWVADVEGRVIHQMWEPSGEAYAERREHVFGESVGAATLAGVSVATGGLV
jgi:Uma2 family endonuclease